MTKYTVNEYIEKFNISRPTIYKKFKNGELTKIEANGRTYIGVNSDVKDKLTELTQELTPVNNDCKDYKEEIKELKIQLADKNEEIKELYNRLINLEREQKEEIIRLQKDKDKQLETFLRLAEKQTQNIITHNEDQTKDKTKKDDDIIEAEVEQPKPKLKKFTDTIAKLNLTKKQHKAMMKRLEKALKKKDDRLVIKDKVIYYYKGTILDDIIHD